MKMISHKANGLQISQRGVDGYINATQMCQANNKEWYQYWRLPSTKEYVRALAKDMKIDVIVNNPNRNNYASALVLTFRGGNSQQGTWVHPEVAVDLAAWISVEFRILVNRWVREWMSVGQNPVTEKVSEVTPEMILAVAKLEESVIGIRSHARVIHNGVHQPIDELLAKSLHSLSHNQLSGANLALEQVRLLKRLLERKLRKFADGREEDFEDFRFTPINECDRFLIPWNLEEYDVGDYYEEMFPDHF